MPSDRIIRPATGKAKARKLPWPKMEQIITGLTRYLHEVPGVVIEQQNDHFVNVNLPGGPRLAFSDHYVEADRPRQFEVFVGDHIDVMTRSSDDYTAALADGFAQQCAYHFGDGTYER